MALLKNVSFDKGAALQTPSSPQNKAAVWLAENRNLANYNGAKRVQRYTLATVFFSTHGDIWKDSTGWLDQEEECGRWFQSEKNGLNCSSLGVVQELHLKKNNLHGHLPPEIGLLSDSLGMIQSLLFIFTAYAGTHCYLLLFVLWFAFAELFNVEDNRLKGTIPTELGRLTQVGETLCCVYVPAETQTNL